MARGKINRGLDSRKAQQVISTAVDAAQTLIKGVADVAERAIAETARAAEDVRTALSRIKEPARKVATGGDARVPKAAAKARGQRRQP